MSRQQRKPKIVKTERNTRIACICEVREAYIVYEGHKIGILSEERNDAEEFDWVIRMDWDEWHKAGEPEIPGINTDLRLDEYIRRYVPVIVEQRTLPDTRDGLWEELDRLGLDWNDRYEYMCRTHGLCGNNDLLIERKEQGD